MNLAAANDEKAERMETLQIGVRQHEVHVFDRERFPLMQSDEDVAALDSGLRRQSCGIDFDHRQAAMQLLVVLGHGLDADRSQADAQLAPD